MSLSKCTRSMRRLLTCLLLLCSVVMFAQERTVKGTVVDNLGDPIMGATIQVKGTKTITVTDLDGAFTVNAAPQAVLEVRYIGFRTATVSLAGRVSVKVELEEGTETMDEVVVVGYGTQKKVNLTGAVASFSSKDIEGIPVANTAALLQGRLPGVTLTAVGGQAGNDDPEIRVRGVGTFGNNNPMVIIDGVEGDLAQIADIAATDIESVSVLKDAASAAIYGVRAANGVILITTKRGQEDGHAKITYNGNITLQTVGVRPDYVNGYQWALMKNEVAPGAYDDAALQHLLTGDDPDHYANTDWLDEMLRTGIMHQHNVSASGGNKTSHYMTSLNYSNQEGIMKGTGIERIGFRANMDTKVKRFTVGINVSGNKNNRQQPATAPNGQDGIMRRVSWFTRPTVPVQYGNGHWGYADGSITDVSLIKNPVQTVDWGHRENEAWRLNSKAFIAVDLYDGLKFQTNFAYNYYHNATKTYNPVSEPIYNPEGDIVQNANGNNGLSEYSFRSQTWTVENLLTYNQSFGSHTVGVLAGHSAIGNRWNRVSAGIQGFPTENIYELGGGTANPSASGSSEEYALQSFFGRVNYSYDNRYLFEFNVRHDGSSRMPKAHRYATFPSVSAGWVFTQEQFMENTQSWLYFGKLRLSWGKLGNQEIGSYAYTAMLGANANYYFNQADNASPVAGMVQTSIPNEKIKWETTTSTNVGLDLGFWDGRVTASFDWFNKETSDILMTLDLPSLFTGSLAAPYQNVGKVRNRGWELVAGYNDRKGDWRWNANFNVSHVKNEILEMGDIDERISGSTINRVGEPIGSMYGLKAIGIYRTEADLQRTNAEGKVITQNGKAPALGDIMFEDYDGDGNISATDYQIIGNPFPKFTYGFNLGFSWKGLDVSTLWQGVAGVYRYNWETTTDIRGNFTTRFLDRWTPENPNGSMPRLGETYNNEYSSFWLEKADYLRLKNLEVGYTFRQPGIKKIGLDHIRLYFAATNILTFTPMEHFDPERPSGDGRNDYHPNTKTYSFGVNLQF